ncbi:MAG: M23 family metallopeptidase, partial [Acidobacteriaceae bacterium]|nr:M23 family metallopeptidase [Acidobacteriaceae bacterium]
DAAGAGTVVEVVNDMPDQVPNQEPVGITIQNAAGNHVIVDMGDGQYALYAHLVPYSATVQVGDVVRQGRRIGLLGDSGNSDAPHLHFQVMDNLQR